ncbi:hypothetical protein [Moraxella pluranimalium]|uniref:Uncharacterized protein n=1 Tax=Moraxella pluranimalium TaxID=470453 RepID=A0A1T0CND6_9GAMM|nr:hypothetical protein [Moraxella pluranimalium]OOS23848.1 hypothetical protein B0680_05850 [Moraxella pluranimalium]
MNQSEVRISKGDIMQFGEYGVAYEVLESIETNNVLELVKIRILESNIVDECRVLDIVESKKLA